MNTMMTDYSERVVPKLVREFGLKSPMAVPRLKKVVINIGVGDSKESKEEQGKAIAELAKIAGQKPSLRQARKDVAGFGIRRGQPVGIAVTLRGTRMYDFLQKLFNIVFPRIRDFRGCPGKSFDRSGNYTLGIAEHTVFPEIDLGKVGKARGLEVTIVTSTRDSQKAKRLLEELGMPFEKG